MHILALSSSVLTGREVKAELNALSRVGYFLMSSISVKKVFTEQIPSS